MITQGNKDNLYRIASNLSYRDYQNSLNSYKRHHKSIKYGDFTYSISDETKEAVNMYGLTFNKDITTEQEEQIKAYLLKIRFTQPDLLEQTNPNYEQWKQATVRSV